MASSGNLGADLPRFHRQMADAFAGPTGTAIRAISGEARQDPGQLGTVLHARIIGTYRRIPMAGYVLVGYAGREVQQIFTKHG